MDDDTHRMTESENAGGKHDSGAEVDWNAALDRTTGDADLLAEVLEARQVETPQMLADIHSALETQQQELLVRAAHTIKNGCYTIGAQEAGDTAYRLEMIAKDAAYDQVPPMLAKLETHLRKIEQEVVQFLRSRRAPE